MTRRTRGTVKRNQGAAPPRAVVAAPTERWWGKTLLLILSVVLLSLAFAPTKQFYLAWFGLVPWLIVVRRSRSAVTAFLWSFLFGCAFFTANMWWLAYVTGPGMAALIAVLALYYAVAGAIIRGTRLLEPGRFWKRSGGSQTDQICPGMTTVSILLIAAVWTALEWFRGFWPLGGLAWAYLGHSQTPVIYLCQIADFSGAFGVSFWVVMINALVAMLILNRHQIERLIPAAAVVGAALVFVLGYGIFRVRQTTTRPGPTVMVVQPNYPQDNSGNKGADPVKIVEFHLDETRSALAQHPKTDLVVWSETMMPALNPEAFKAASQIPSPYWQNEAMLMRETMIATTKLAEQYRTAILTGGVYHNDFKTTV
ncbi:MAG TPA: hypothetical protein VLJ39_08155, partial [Tepidisphaeraceae bacterium]|nr:hypothetical protein [Tepidisphaeraceae bacterium]